MTFHRPSNSNHHTPSSHSRTSARLRPLTRNKHHHSSSNKTNSNHAISNNTTFPVPSPAKLNTAPYARHNSKHRLTVQQQNRYPYQQERYAQVRPSPQPPPHVQRKERKERKQQQPFNHKSYGFNQYQKQLQAHVEKSNVLSPKGGPEPSLPYVVVQTVDECRSAVEALSVHERIAVDCEGVALSRTGRLCLLQAASPESVYIIDLIPNNVYKHNKSTVTAINNNNRKNEDNTETTECEQLAHARKLFELGGLKELLENKQVYKVMHDCRHDSDALYHQFNVRLGPVIDTQVAFFVLRRAMGLEDGLPVSLKTLLRKFSLVSEDDLDVKNAVKDSMRGDDDFWLQRPLTDVSLWYARLDVEHLLRLSVALNSTIAEHNSWDAVLTESKAYLALFRDDVHGPRKAELEYELRARVARRQRMAEKFSRKAQGHHRNDPLRCFSFDYARVVDALNG